MFSLRHVYFVCIPMAVLVMLFWQPEVLCAIPGWFFAHPWALALLAASLAGAWFFVFWPERKKG